MEHTDNTVENIEDKCDCIPKNAISFLDTLCKISEGKIEIDLFRKESDRNQYLLPSSIHPKTVTKNIPFSLSLRIVRVCTNNKERDQRHKELKNMLLSRE